MKNLDRGALEWIDGELTALDAQDLRRQRSTHFGPQQVRLQVDGQDLINFGSNDYLGLASDPRLAAAVATASEQVGWGAGASPLITGHAELHRQLEEELARFERTEAALLFPSGFAANSGTIPALVGRGDAIYGDEKNHASIIDGCRLSRADVHIYRHGDVDHLAALLQDSGRYCRRLIVTDTLFSMDGDLAPLDQLVALAKRHEAMLMADEAHATGVFGAEGRGVAEQLQVEEEIDIRVGTLSKALGCSGGFVAGRQKLIDWLINRARPYVFSTATPPAMCAAALAALQIVRSEPYRRRDLLVRAGQLRTRLAAQGWSTGGGAGQIIPLHVGDAGATMRLARALREQGLLVPGIRPPSVPAGESMLRLSLSYLHTPEMIDRLSPALAQVRS